MDPGPCVVAVPPRVQVLDTLVQAVVEPVVHQEVTPEIPDKAAARRPPRPERLLDASPRIAEPYASDRIAGHDEPPPGLDGNRSPTKRRNCRSHLVQDVRLGERRDIRVPRDASVTALGEERGPLSRGTPRSHDHGDDSRRAGDVLGAEPPVVEQENAAGPTPGPSAQLEPEPRAPRGGTGTFAREDVRSQRYSSGARQGPGSRVTG